MKNMRLVVWLFAAFASLSPARAAAPTTKYLLFQIFTYPGLAGGVQPVSTVVKSIVDAVRTTGTSARRLGFVVGPLTFDHSDAELVALIDQSFAAAATFNVPVMFAFDDSMFWKNRPDLWMQHQNVEWTSWSGTEAGPRILPWYTAATLAPQMCYNSPIIRQAIAARVRQVAGPEILKNLAALNAQGKAALFAGIIVGWETMLPDVNPPVGYCALTNLGYSAANPPADMNATLVGVVYQFLQFWEQQFIDAGFSPGKLFTHIAVSPPGAANDHAPVGVAFGPRAHAGFTDEGTQGQVLPQIYQTLKTEPDKQWGISEGSNVYPPNALPSGSGKPDLPMGAYLAQAYGHGAVYVDLFGWQSTGSAFQAALTDPNAIRAYRRFLQGGIP